MVNKRQAILKSIVNLELAKVNIGAGLRFLNTLGIYR